MTKMAVLGRGSMKDRTKVGTLTVRAAPRFRGLPACPAQFPCPRQQRRQRRRQRLDPTCPMLLCQRENPDVLLYLRLSPGARVSYRTPDEAERARGGCRLPGSG